MVQAGFKVGLRSCLKLSMFHFYCPSSWYVFPQDWSLARSLACWTVWPIRKIYTFFIGLIPFKRVLNLPDLCGTGRGNGNGVWRLIALDVDIYTLDILVFSEGREGAEGFCKAPAETRYLSYLISTPLEQHYSAASGSSAVFQILCSCCINIHLEGVKWKRERDQRFLGPIYQYGLALLG